MKLVKRAVLTLVAFIVASVFIALWREHVPSNPLTGAAMAVIAVGMVFGTWKWSDRM
jgi:hypothetical protein